MSFSRREDEHFRMSFFVVRMYFSLSWDKNTSRWILAQQIFHYYILTTSKLHPDYKNVYPNYKKGHPYYDKLHPIYEQTTFQLRGRRSENLKRCLIFFNGVNFWGNVGTRVIIFGQVLCVPSFVLF